MNTPPPHSQEAELAVLGACMIDRDAIDMAQREIQAGDFFDPMNTEIFKTITSMHGAGEGVDVITVAQRGHDELYLMECVNSVTSAANVRYHCQIVKNAADLRLTAQTARITLDETQGKGANPSEIAEKAVKVYSDMLMGRSSLRDAISLTQAKDDLLVSIEEWHRIHDESGIIGVPTGFTVLDGYFGGWRPEYYIIAARPSVGKTALALQSMYHAAKAGSPVLVFSLEMSTEKLAIRMMAAEANVNGSRINRGDLVTSEMTRIAEASSRIQGVPLYIVDSIQSIEDIKLLSRKLHREKGIKCVVIDYLQLSCQAGGNENRQQEVSYISRQCKALQKELDIPVIALSQLSRPMKGREHFEPVLSDLRESGSLEQDADVVMFLHREYKKNVSGQQKPVQSIDGKTYQVKFLIDKNRGGAIADCNMTFDGPTTSFREGEMVDGEQPNTEF